ncbi:MAG TPA: aldehyde dehydrogenase family protein [Acidimicrobiales bacterium]|nr:aldehyde dehydrogenase family protein [Acidimicrobiales bacterium]
MNKPRAGILDAIDPATEKVFATLPASSPADVATVVQRARHALETNSQWRTPALRAHTLYEMARLLRENADELALAECRDTGKPLAQGRDDVMMSAAYFTYYAGWVDKFGGRSIPLGSEFVDYTVREPWGVCGQIIPWNYPLQVTARCAAPAMAVGNAVVLKPSEQASVTPYRLMTLYQEAGLAEHMFNVVLGAGDVGSALVGDPGVDHVTFVGSAAVGQRVAQQCLERYIPVELEMGGKSPSIVFEDADLDRAVPVIVRALIQNAGQSCSAGSRVIIASSIYDQVIARLVEALAQLSVGPGEADFDLGPLISPRQLEHAQDMVARAREHGARVVCGGKRPSALSSGWYLEPTLIDNVAADAEIFQEEVFGPVLVASRFANDDEAVTLANDSRYGLVAGVWTRDLRRAHAVANRLEVGQVFVNSYGVGGGVAIPFGGLKRSGHARGKSEDALLAYSRVKNICIAL